ncbi:MAG TPA: DUF58 domain-containing protein [Firmicutes bacterium]|nr:DUF58 domain-containing protein [Bacillota bacterium]
MEQHLALDLHRLDRLIISFKGGLAGFYSGQRLTNKYGTSLEFADYRPYLPGDDIRRIDWLLYGRSERLYTRLNRSEVDATVNFLIDSSGSMDWGDPHKGWRALQLTLALGYISLQSYDRVAVGLGCKDMGTYLPPLYGKGAFPRLSQFLQRQEFDREGNLNQLLASFQKVLKPRQMTVLLSDFLSPGGYREGLEKLLAARQELVLIHLASPDELEPTFAGPVALLDVETNRKKEVTVDPYLKQGYREAVQQHRQEIAGFCRRRDINYLLYNTLQDPVEFLLTSAPRLFKSMY